MPTALKLFITLSIISAFCFFAYKFVENRYHDEGFEERIEELQSYLKLRRKLLKHKEVDMDEFRCKQSKCYKILDE